MKPTLGILGGMGPLATVDFMRKVIGLTPAAGDQDHIPMVVASIPQVPDRTAAILGSGESPLPAMLEGIRLLNQAAVDAVAIPCNTAHYWFDELARQSQAPILHIVDAALAVLEERAQGARTVGLMGTTGTVKSGIYQRRIEALGYACLAPDAGEQERLVMGGIYKIKAGDPAMARHLLERAADGLRARGAGAIVLGCTEIPIVMEDGGDLIDATLALAGACVRRFTAAATA
jgi:aspartate racemase